MTGVTFLREARYLHVKKKMKTEIFTYSRKMTENGSDSKYNIQNYKTPG